MCVVFFFCVVLIATVVVVVVVVVIGVLILFGVCWDVCVWVLCGFCAYFWSVHVARRLLFHSHALGSESVGAFLRP